MVLIKIKDRPKSGPKRPRVRVVAQSQPGVGTPVSKQSETTSPEAPPAFRPAWALGKVKPKVKSALQDSSSLLAAQQARKPFPSHQHRVQAEAKLAQLEQNPRFEYEREKMESIENLAGVADDVEAEATLYEWRAGELRTRQQSPRWYIILAVVVTVAVGLLIFLGNFLGAIAIGLVGTLLYVISQRQSAEVRYRIMADGVAVNERLYQYQNLDAFNIIYRPGEVKTVIIRSKKMFSPLIQMEIGEADPREIRDILLEFLREDLDIQEPLTDTWVRRLGY